MTFREKCDLVNEISNLRHKLTEFECNAYNEIRMWLNTENVVELEMIKTSLKHIKKMYQNTKSLYNDRMGEFENEKNRK